MHRHSAPLICIGWDAKGERLLANKEQCNYREGPLPSCAPLALGTIPKQQGAQPAYEKDEALVKGTLFPGLDLPFMDYTASGTLEDAPLYELMALDFVTQELALYLNTHENDAEAFETWKCFTELAEEGRRRYAEQYGPLKQAQTAMFDSWVWPDEPWPWEFMANGGNN